MKVNHILKQRCQRTTPSVWICKGVPSSALLTAVWCFGSWEASQSRRQWICVWPSHRPERPTFRTFDPALQWKKLQNRTNSQSKATLSKLLHVASTFLLDKQRHTSDKTYGKRDLTSAMQLTVRPTGVFYVFYHWMALPKSLVRHGAYKPLTRNG